MGSPVVSGEGLARSRQLPCITSRASARWNPGSKAWNGNIDQQLVKGLQADLHHSLPDRPLPGQEEAPGSGDLFLRALPHAQGLVVPGNLKAGGVHLVNQS